MTSNNIFLSKSLINAAVASLVGNLDIRTTGAAPLMIGAAPTSDPGLHLVPVVIDVVKQYHSSLVPSVLPNGQSVPGDDIEGPVKLDESCLAPEFDYDFTNTHDDGTQYERGNHPYQRPCGSYRIALKVKDQFTNDNTWLGMTGKEAGEWPVSYHGTAKHSAQNIAQEGYRLSSGKRFLHGIGIYSTPDIAVAKLYATKFNHEGSSYKCILQNRVNPKYLKVFSKEETRVGIYWLSNDDQDDVDESELIRPYGICLFKE